MSELFELSLLGRTLILANGGLDRLLVLGITGSGSKNCYMSIRVRLGSSENEIYLFSKRLFQ